MDAEIRENEQGLQEISRLRKRLAELEVEALRLDRENQELRRTASLSSVILESEPGKGSRVRVLFPQVETEPAARDWAADAEGELAAQLKGALAQGTILVVDDDSIVREVCRDMLVFSGYRVLEAEDGEEGVQVFADHVDGIDGVILDLSMPRMDGVGALRELRRIRPEVKVILCSGYTEGDAIERFAEPGFDAFIQKPYRIKTLQLTLERVLRDNPGRSHGP
jgi:CheY-like chemotaxis protein